MIELLSPAGSWESLKAAVSNGADAVYLGAGAFNARMRAENFSLKDLQDAVSFCHDSGVRVYLTANTLVKNDELKTYFSALEDAYSAGMDSVIIQELSFAPLIKESFPDLWVHASTQAGVFNSLYPLEGLDRVILPREYTLSQVKAFREDSGLEVEVFVQGALCFSVGGQCLMSSFLGGRSANRGLCAQPCRKRYNKKFLLSTKDLCLVEKIRDLEAAGVSSLKIEGRLRSPEYVAAATRLYRKALDSGVVDPDALVDMLVAFSRGYTPGLMFREKDVVYPDSPGKRGVYLGVLEKDGMMSLREGIRVGDGVGFGSHGDVIRKIVCKGKEVDFAGRGSKVRLFLNAKEGSKVFLTSAGPRAKSALFARKKPIVSGREHRKFVFPDLEKAHFPGRGLLVKTYSVEAALEALGAGADLVFYDLFAQDFPAGENIMPYVPRCLPEWKAKDALSRLSSLGAGAILSGDLGVAAAFPGESFLDISGNCFNDLDVSFFRSHGIKPIASPELSFSELSAFKDKRFVVYAHGRVPLMTSKYALEAEVLTDELGYSFPVRRESDYLQVLNSVTLGLWGRIHELSAEGVGWFFLDLEEDVEETVSLYRGILSGAKAKKKGFTLGAYSKGVI